MKKIILFIILAIAFNQPLIAQKKSPTVAASSVAICCPEFKLEQDYKPPCSGNCPQDANGTAVGGGTPGGAMMASCRTTHSYTVVPNLIASGYTYTWTVIGGTPTSATGNPINITWAAASINVQITVVITGPNGCNKTIKQNICLVDGPIANIITASPNPVCGGTPVSFSAANTSTMSYDWDFGDGTYATGQNVTHTYAYSASTPCYNAILTVRGDTSKRGCGCFDRDTVQICVNNGTGLQITPVSCKKIFCPGDTATFCATNCAGPYTWTVVGGTPATFTGNCVNVTWNASSLVPASVTVSTPNCPAGCGGSATLPVPVLFPNLQINGATTVCPGSITNYSLPNLPGAFYSWSLSGGGFIASSDSNLSNIVINWNSFPSSGGPYTLTCNYHNPITGCKGTSTINILVKPPFTINAFTIPCVGNPFNYSNAAIPTDPVAWTITPAHAPFPLTAPSISGTWAAANTYTILATPVNPANYCTSSATAVVTVNPKPVITAITPNTPVCKGSTQVYAATSSLPAAGSFSWTTVGSTGTNVLLGAHNDSIQITWDPLAPTYSITVSQQVNGCYAVPFTQTLAFIPNPTISPVTSTVCIDAVTTFTASGGTSYTCAINNSLGSLASPQGSNPMNVQWNGSFTAGTFPSIVTVTNQCGNTASATVNVITPNAFTITQSGDLCNPTGVLLTTSGGVSGYVWTGPSVSGTGSSVNALAPGLYTVTANGTGGCPVKATITVLPKFLSAVTISSGASQLLYCPGDPINVVLPSSFSSSYTGCTYQWYQNGVSMGVGYTGAILTITSVSVFTNNPGTNSFYVIVKCGGCTTQSNAISVTLYASCIPTADCPYPSAKLLDRLDDNSLAKHVTKKGGPSESIFSFSPIGTVNITSPSTGATLCGGTGTFTSTYTLALGSLANAFWSFGDGTFASGTQTGSGFGPFNNTVTHSYTHCGNYQVIMYVYVQCSVAPAPITYCVMTDTINVVVPAVAKFNPTVVCNKVYLQDLSSVCSAACNFNYAWSATGPVGSTVSFSPAASGAYSTIANTTVMTASMAGTYNITLTLTSASCGCIGPNAVVFSQNVVINLPTAAFTALSPVCAGTPISFTTTSVGTSYNWNFYSTYQSNLQTTVHSFPAPPPSSRLVTLTVKDANGCIATSSQNINVLPPITVNITGVLDICPGGITTLTANTAAAGPTYQWYHNGVMVGSNSSTYNATSTGQYWVTVSSSSGGCFATSPKVTVKLKQAPIAKIVPVYRICIGGSGGATLQNSINQINTTYTWSVLSAPTTVTFSPNGTNAAWQTTATPGAAIAGDYIFILIALNTISGCEAKDTICIKAYNKPVFTVSGAPGCEGVNNTFTALPAITYNYLWSNGATGNVMTTSIAGLYDVMATDPISGCSSAQFGVALVKPKPNVSLFPLSGCDTLCNKDTLVPPLPLTIGQTYAGVYTINWYDGATLIYTGPYLVLNTLTPNPGQHNIHIVVTFIGSTCISTSGDYNVYIKNCDSCNCDNSSWGEISWVYANALKKSAAQKANVPIKNILKCGDNLGNIDCNKPITINASYNCAGTNCVGVVKYSLTGPVTQNGTVPFTTAGLPVGNYVLTLYGICGTDTCKVCEFPFTIICEKDCCKGSVWEQQPWYSFDKTGKKKEKFNCNEQEQVIVITGDLCKLPLTFGGVIKCPTDCISIDSVFIYDGANILVQSGVAPYTITALPNGTYTVEVVGYCGGQPCLRCKVILKIDCEQQECDCKGSKWGEKIITINNASQSIVCGKNYDVKCKTPVSINANYICADASCAGSVTYTLVQPSGTTSGNVPLNFTPTQNGVYTVTLFGICGTTICDSCVVKFIVRDCPIDTSCCPYPITVTPKEPTYVSNPTSTIVSNNFAISIPAIANITEVRANVVSYTIDDNYKKECMQCVNLPFTWASVSTATNINTAPPKITMYSGTSVASFSGTGAGAYQNPREIIWNNGTNLNAPNITNVGMNFILPPTPTIDCCELKGTICVKFIFRDNDCKECEVIACFNFIIKKK